MLVVKYNPSISDDLELELTAKVKVKTLRKNLKTPMWHFDDS